MAKRNRGEKLERVPIGGVWHRLVLGLIHTKNPGGEEFVTLYVPEEMIHRS